MCRLYNMYFLYSQYWLCKYVACVVLDVKLKRFDRGEYIISLTVLLLSQLTFCQGSITFFHCNMVIM